MIPLFTVNMPKEVNTALLSTIHSGYITQGPKVEEFENQLNLLFRTSYAVTVNSGTSALTLALRLANVGPGDEVVTTPMTCSATNLPILSLGAIPVWADVDPITGLLLPEAVRAKMTPKTKAIIVVDWGGAKPELVQLRKIADEYGVKLIEDSAHSFGAEHTKKHLADFTCFSLQAIKHITTGDGGVLVCTSQKDYERAKLLRWFGINRAGDGKDTRIDEEITEWGYKFHMNDLTATIGIAQLPALPVILDRHQAIADHYRQHINDSYIHPPRQSGFWLYTLLLPNTPLRGQFKKFMAEEGIQVSQVHRRNDEYKVFKASSGTMLGRWHPNSYPGLNNFAGRMICIPIHNNLTNTDIRKIVKACNIFAGENL